MVLDAPVGDIDEDLPPAPAMAAPVSVARGVLDAGPLLASLALLMLGTSLHGTVLGLRGPMLGFGTVTIGAVLSAYYLGFLIGSVTIGRLIAAVGHIRSFAGLASMASAAVLLYAVWDDPLVWWLLRILSGICVSGLFVVTESWLNGAATNRTRGGLLASYMVVLTGSIALSQLLLALTDPSGFAVFVLASVLVSVAVVPIALMPSPGPPLQEPAPMAMRDVIRAAPLSVVGSVASGITGAAAVGAGAVYASAIGLPIGRVAVLLASMLVAALVLQFPLGLLSDRVDRRRVIAAVSLSAAVASVIATRFDGDQFGFLVVAAAIAGGMAYPLYSLSSAHLNDWIEPGVVVAAGARIVLVQGAGAVAGPLGATVAIRAMGPEGFFVLLAVTYAATAAFAVYRLSQRPPAPEEQRSAFAPVPPGSSPSLAGLALEAAEELYPITEAREELGGTLLAWRERGAGHPVVLVHDAGSSGRAWDEVQLLLADRGHRAVAYDLRGHGASGSTRTYGLSDHVRDLGELLDHLDVHRLVLVGHGAGAVIAARFALSRPDRVAGLVLVGPDQDLARGRREAARRVADRSVQAAARTVLGARVAGALGASATLGPRRRNPGLHRRLATDLAMARRAALAATRRDARRAAVSIDPAQLQPALLWIRGDRIHPRPDDPEGLIVVPDAGHYVHLERPEPVAEAIEAFLTSIDVWA